MDTQEQDILANAARYLKRNWQLAVDDEQTDYQAYLELIRERLAGQVYELLAEDMNRLMNILYRLDVREVSVEAAMQLPGRALIAGELARLIVDREIEKARTRIEYSQK